MPEGRRGFTGKLPKHGATGHVPPLSSSARVPCPEVGPGSEVKRRGSPSPNVAKWGNAEGAVLQGQEQRWGTQPRQGRDGTESHCTNPGGHKPVSVVS